MNSQQNKALHELIQEIRLTISKPSRESDSTLIFKHLLEVLNVLRNINCIHKFLSFHFPHYLLHQHSELLIDAQL